MLNARGDFNYEKDWRALRRLAKKAFGQRPDDLPFIVFLDVNLPPSPGVPFDAKPWLKDAFEAIDSLGLATKENPDPFNMLFITNFAIYFGATNKESPPGEWSVVVPRYPAIPLPNRGLVDLLSSTIDRYGRIPREVYPPCQDS